MKCQSCNSATINGVFCHEKGCPEAWKDEKRSCQWCGILFAPDENNQVTCSHSCFIAYWGYSCDCEECNSEND